MTNETRQLTRQHVATNNLQELLSFVYYHAVCFFVPILRPYNGNKFDLISLHSINILWRKWTLTACRLKSLPLPSLSSCAVLVCSRRSTRPRTPGIRAKPTRPLVAAATELQRRLRFYMYIDKILNYKNHWNFLKKIARSSVPLTGGLWQSLTVVCYRQGQKWHPLLINDIFLTEVTIMYFFGICRPLKNAALGSRLYRQYLNPSLRVTHQRLACHKYQACRRLATTGVCNLLIISRVLLLILRGGTKIAFITLFTRTKRGQQFVREFIFTKFKSVPQLSNMIGASAND